MKIYIQREISMEYLFIWAILGPYMDHFGNMFGPALLPKQLDPCSFKTELILCNAHFYVVFTFQNHVRAMSGPHLDQVWPNSFAGPARALKCLFSLLFVTMPGLCLNLVGILFGLYVLLDELELGNFPD